MALIPEMISEMPKGILEDCKDIIPVNLFFCLSCIQVRVKPSLKQPLQCQAPGWVELWRLARGSHFKAGSKLISWEMFFENEWEGYVRCHKKANGAVLVQRLLGTTYKFFITFTELWPETERVITWHKLYVPKRAWNCLSSLKDFAEWTNALHSGNTLNAVQFLMGIQRTRAGMMKES